MVYIRPKIRTVVVLICVCVWLTEPLAQANPPNPGSNLFSIFRFQNNSNARSGSDRSTSLSHHRLAKTLANQNDIDGANTSFTAALRYATPNQVPDIASDFATFLMETGDLHRAELILRQALTQSPDEEKFIKMLARCLVLQNRTIEGLRHFKSIYPETKAREQIAIIYQERGNAEMLLAIERQWGVTLPKPNVTISEPVRIIATPSQMPRTLPQEASSISTTLPLAGVVQAAFSATPPTVPETIKIAMPAGAPHSRSEFFATKIPIPIPNTTHQPLLADSPRPTQVFVPSQPVIQPRRHYVINAVASPDINTLFPVIPASSVTPAE